MQLPPKEEVHAAICGDLPWEPVTSLKEYASQLVEEETFPQPVMKKAQFPSYAVLQRHLFLHVICNGKKD